MSRNAVMRCWNCGKQMTSVEGVYEYENRHLGRMSVPCFKGELYTCDCGEAPYVSAKLSARMKEYEQQRIEQMLLISVGGDMQVFKSNLIGMSELQRLLGVTRQAIGKTPRYRNHIYHVVMNGERLWWRPSVLLFREKGDGRFAFRPLKTESVRRLRALIKMIREIVPVRSAAMFAL